MKETLSVISQSKICIFDKISGRAELNCREAQTPSQLPSECPGLLCAEGWVAMSQAGGDSRGQMPYSSEESPERLK